MDGVCKPYLVLETSNMSATVTMETWILNASAKLGAIGLLDYLNKGTTSIYCVFVFYSDILWKCKDYKNVHVAGCAVYMWCTVLRIHHNSSILMFAM